MRVYISPSPLGGTPAVGGIYRVIDAQGKWLPQCGVEIVDSPEKAQVINTHAGDIVDLDRPIVTSNHGLYWTGDMDWHEHYWYFNNRVIEALRRAHQITVPSEWVAYPIRRDMHRSPIVIPHGIEADQFEYTPDHGGYVLWGKPRVDVVSDPEPVNQVARQCGDLDFRTTFGHEATNVRVLGALPYADFQGALRHAGVWLATTRETGDIASREAMAYGVPVVGWNWGATKDLVIHGETGYLAEPGNYNDLAEGLRWCLANREYLGKQAREVVLQNYTWEKIIPRYAAVYRSALDQDAYEYDVSFVIPSYNYAQYLPECLNSILDNKWSFGYEVIVVDDCSTDNTQDVLSHFDGIRVIRHQSNVGLSSALNTGHQAAKGRYLSNLDADNIIAPGFEDLYRAMESYPWVDVGTAPYRIMNTDRVHGGEPDVWKQLDHYNQIPSTCLIRARSIQHLGGYRRRAIKNEDAEFWCRAMSAGIRAQFLSDKVCFEYRWHGKNKSAEEGGEDDRDSPLSWNFYCPWRIHHDIVPFAMLGHPPRGSWAVRSYEQPHVSVVVPCGPGHQKYLMDALDSVAAQTYNNIECVVANDTGEALDVAAMGHPWVRVVNTKGRQGPAVARNTAIHAARAPLIVPVDADDMLYPGIVEQMYRAWVKDPDCLVYADCEIEDRLGNPRKPYHSGRWSWEKISHEAIYQDTILFAKKWWEAVDGYPAEFSLWEDWLFGVKLHIAGVGAVYLEGVPWGVYRHWTSLDSGRSKSDGDNEDYGSEAFKERVARSREWIERKVIEMPCKSCGGKGKSKVTSAAQSQDPLVVQALSEGQSITVVYKGGRGTVSINSPTYAGRKYRVRGGEPFEIPPEDASLLRLANIERIEMAPVPTHGDLPKHLPQVPRLEVDAPRANLDDAIEVAHGITLEREPMPAAEEEKPGEPVEMDPYSEPLSALSEIPYLPIDKLKESGFTTLADIRRDIVMNGGAGITAIKGVGTETLRRIEDFMKGLA